MGWLGKKWTRFAVTCVAGVALAGVPCLGLVACSDAPQETSSAASVSATPPSSSSTQQPASEDAVYMLVRQTNQGIDQNGYAALDPVVSTTTIDEHGSTIGEAEEEGTGVEAGTTTYTVDENGFPKTVESTGEHDDFGTGDVEISGAKSGDALTIMYPSGIQIALQLDSTKTQVTRVAVAEREEGASEHEPLALSSERIYDDNGLLQQQRIMYLEDTGVETSNYTWTLDENGFPASVKTKTTYSDGTGNTMEPIVEDFTVECDEAGNITAFVNDKNTTIATFEYQRVDDPSMAAKVYSSTKPAP